MRPISLGKLTVPTPGTPIRLGVTSLTSNVATDDSSFSVASASPFCQDMIPFKMDIDPTLASYEMVMVTGISNKTFTVSRGIDGTTAQTHTTGAFVGARFPFSGWKLCNVQGSTGKVFWGTKNMSVTASVGMITEFPPVSSGANDTDDLTGASQDGNPLWMSDFSIDAAQPGEGLYVTLWQR